MIRWRSSRTPIGIWLDARFITAAQLARTPTGLRLEAASRWPRTTPGLPLHHEETLQLRAILARQGFRGNRVVLAVPPDDLIVELLELPPASSGAPLEQIARVELARMHNYDPQEAETVCWGVPPSGRLKETTKFLAMAYPHPQANAFLDLFEAAGLEVEAMDSHALALSRACRGLVSSDGISVGLDLEHEWSMLILFCKGTIVYQRTTKETGFEKLSKAFSEQLGLGSDAIDCLLKRCPSPDAAVDEGLTSLLASMRKMTKRYSEEVFSETRSPIEYVMQQYPELPIRSFWLTGCGAAIPGVAEFLGESLGTRVEVAKASDILAVSPALAERMNDPAMTKAIGLAEFGEE